MTTTQINKSTIQLSKKQDVESEVIRERYNTLKKLPEDLQKAIFAVKTADLIKEITTKDKLDRDQLKSISYIIGLILLGEINIVDFVKTLQEKCGITEEPARKLARDINQAIFLPVKESLKKIHKISKWPREDETDDKAISETTSSEPIGPRLEGNIVDLKGE